MKPAITKYLAAIGSTGGKSKSKAKRSAAKLNGAKGGRPKGKGKTRPNSSPFRRALVLPQSADEDGEAITQERRGSGRRASELWS